MSITPDCTIECEAAPDCIVCRRRKQPRGRDVGVYTSGSYCEHECPGHNEPPHAGHLFPGEIRRTAEDDAERARDAAEQLAALADVEASR